MHIAPRPIVPIVPPRGPRWFRPRTGSRSALEAQVREELETHVAMATDYLVARGLARADAEREARARFGDFDEALQRVYQTASAREASMSRHERIDNVWQDVRLALRLFRRSPAFFAGLVLTLAVGIGANGAVFSMLRAALLQPLPYRDPSRLVMLWGAYPATESRLQRHVLSAESVLGWRREISPQLGDVAAVLSWQDNLEGAFDYLSSNRAERLNGAFVTPNFFSVLGVRAAVGRVFAPADERGPALIVLSHALWQRDFGGDPSIVGRPITLTVGKRHRAPRSFIVAGVLPSDVHFTYPEETEAWVMVPWTYLASYVPHAIAFGAVMRLAPGVSLDGARRRAALFRTGLYRPNERPQDREAMALEPIHDWVVGDIRPSLQLLGAVAALLLVITCVTVANALLARASERQQELAVRSALGAARGRLVQQLLTEGALLAAAGAAAGTLLATVALPVVQRLMPASIPRVGDLSAHLSMLGFGGAMATVTMLLTAVAPAWGGTHGDAAARFGASGTRTSAAAHTARWRQGLVAAEAAVATALLISATLLLVSFWRLGRVPLGFHADHVVTVEMRLVDRRYYSDTVVARLQDAMLTRVRAIPGVAEAGLTSAVPFRGVDFLAVFGDESTGPKPANLRYVDPAYFSVLRIPLLRGRLPAATDRMGAPPVAVVSESFAHMYFGNEDPLGRQITLTRPLRVVGVVGDVRYAGFDKAPVAAVYIPAAQSPNQLFCIVARTPLDVAAIAPAIRGAIHEVDPTVPAMNITTIDQIVDRSVANRRFYTAATATFATIALLLTVIGLTVVVARVVTERRRELAIRAALGATPGRLTRSATMGVMSAVTIGVLAGALGAYAASKGLEQFLFQVAPHAFWVYAGICALVLGAAFIAALVPVRQLSALSLMSALNAE